METLTSKGRKSWFPSGIYFSQFNRVFEFEHCFPASLLRMGAFSSSLASITSNLTVVMEALTANSGCGETEAKNQLLEREQQGPMLGCLWTNVMFCG